MKQFLFAIIFLTLGFAGGTAASYKKEAPKAICVEVDGAGIVQVEAINALLLTRLSDGAQINMAGSIEDVMASKKVVACPK